VSQPPADILTSHLWAEEDEPRAPAPQAQLPTLSSFQAMSSAAASRESSPCSMQQLELENAAQEDFTPRQRQPVPTAAEEAMTAGPSCCAPPMHQSPMLERLSARIARHSQQVEALKAQRDEDDATLALLSSVAAMNPGMCKSLKEPMPSRHDLRSRIEKTMAEVASLEAQHEALSFVDAYSSSANKQRGPTEGRSTPEPLVSLDVPTPPKVSRAARSDSNWQRLQRELVDPRPILRAQLDKACLPEKLGPRTYPMPRLAKPKADKAFSKTGEAATAAGVRSVGSFELLSVDPLKEHIAALCHNL